MISSQSSSVPDLEANDYHAFLMNNTVQTFAWKDVAVTVKDRETGKPKKILSSTSGHVSQGKIKYAKNPFFQ